MVTGARGATFADVARASGSFGANPQDNDADVSRKFADYAIQQNPNFKGDTGDTGPANSTYATLAALKAAAITNGTANLTQAGLQGAFVWAPDDFTGLADDINIVGSDNAPLSDGAWVRTGDLLAIMGTGDNAPYLQAIINAAPVVRVPHRGVPYTLGSRVFVPSNRTILFDDKVTFNYTGPSSHPVGTLGVFYSEGGRNIQLLAPADGLVTIRCAQAQAAVYAFHGMGVAGVKLRGLMGSNCSLARFLPAVVQDGQYVEVGYEDADTSSDGININRDIEVLGGGAMFDVMQVAAQPSLHAVYVINWRAAGGRYKNVCHAICGWGGNANPNPNQSGNGVLTNERKNARFVVEDNIVEDAQNGGIWFSMARDGVVRNNTVRRAHDVGIDPEGCVNVTVENNLVVDCDNGNLSTFYLGRGTVFRGNRSIGRICLRIYNSSLSALNEDVTISDNDFSGPIDVLGVAGEVGAVTLDFGPVRNVAILLNRFTNAKCDLAAVNVTTVTATSNVFRLSIPAAASTRLLSVDGLRNTGFGDGRATIDLNQFYSEVAQFPNVEPIYVGLGDFNANSTATISRNKTRGFSGFDIHCVSNGGNPGTTAYFKLRDNDLGHGAIMCESTNAGGSYVFDRLGNVDVNGAPLDATSGAYTMDGISQAVSGAGGVTLKLSAVDGSPPGTLDAATGIVTITTPGFYSLVVQARPQDGTATGIAYAVGVGLGNVDNSASVQWAVTGPQSSSSSSATRQGLSKSRAMQLNRGDQLRAYAFSPETALTLTSASLSITRVS